MRWAQHRLPSAPILACVRPCKGTVGARSVESSASRQVCPARRGAHPVPPLCFPPLLSNGGKPSLANAPFDQKGRNEWPFPPLRPRLNPGETQHPLHCTCPFFLLCSLARLVRDLTRCCVDPLAGPSSNAPLVPEVSNPAALEPGIRRARADQVAQVLHLVADPARDVVGSHHLARGPVHPVPIFGRHRQTRIHRGGGGLDVERIDRQHVLAQLFVCPSVFR